MTRRMTVLFAGALMTASAFASQAVAADPGVDVGVLRCDVAGGTGFIIGSSKTLDCVYEAAGGHTEAYSGSIDKFGLDIGKTDATQVVWGVLAPTADLNPGSLAGRYVGVSAEATVGVGLGANALVGGFNKSITLNPISVQAQQGLNIAAGIASLSLSPMH